MRWLCRTIMDEVRRPSGLEGAVIGAITMIPTT
jgi:hypothetical protein